MWWPIRNQILVPFAAVLLAAVMLTAVTAAVDAARRSERATVAQLNQVIETLGQSNFPYAQSVLDKMKGLSGAEFVVFDEAGRPTLATLPDAPSRGDLPADIRGEFRDSLGAAPTIVVGETRYFASTVDRRALRGDSTTLLVLYPETSWKQARSDAIGPPLWVGAGTILATALVSAWIAQRFSRRIRTVQEQVASIAGGDFREIPSGGRHDEIRDLEASVNRMSRQLREQQETIRRTERTRLLGQLASGLAHQLRNAVTGARMAVQIHRRRHTATADDSLDVALRQLALMEEQVKGLLSLGKSERRSPIERSAREVLEEVASLVRPACAHAGISWTCETDNCPDVSLPDADPLRTALVNLVLNAIDAAGSGGCVELSASSSEGNLLFDVSDSGEGPPPDVADSMFELFVTGKPEGVGIGLAMARQTAEQLGGRLDWTRENGRTRFRITLPAGASIPGARKLAAR